MVQNGKTRRNKHQTPMLRSRSIIVGKRWSPKSSLSFPETPCKSEDNSRKVRSVGAVDRPALGSGEGGPDSAGLLLAVSRAGLGGNVTWDGCETNRGKIHPLSGIGYNYPISRQTCAGPLGQHKVPRIDLRLSVCKSRFPRSMEKYDTMHCRGLLGGSVGEVS